METILDILVCPSCKQKFADEKQLTCNNCEISFPIRQNVTVTLLEEAISTKDGNVVALQNENKEHQKTFYTQVGQHLSKTADEIGFLNTYHYMNFGYVANQNQQYATVDLPPYMLHKNSVKLTLEVVGNADLEDKKILEVGCGRGGNILTMNKYYNPASIVGLDLCEYSIDYCQQNHTEKELFFTVGDAESLPFPNEEFDVLFNLESSHAYPNLTRFYHEVNRVLKPGGLFLYSDNLFPGQFLEAEQYLRELGFVIERNQDITENILKSCDEIAVNRKGAFQSVTSKDQSYLEDFVASPGSPVYEEMNQRKRYYKILKLRKQTIN